MVSPGALRSAVASHRAQHTAVAQWMFAELPATETGPSKRGELFLDSLAVSKGPSSCLSEVQGPGRWHLSPGVPASPGTQAGLGARLPALL